MVTSLIRAAGPGPVTMVHVVLVCGLATVAAAPENGTAAVTLAKPTRPVGQWATRDQQVGFDARSTVRRQWLLPVIALCVQESWSRPRLVRLCVYNADVLVSGRSKKKWCSRKHGSVPPPEMVGRSCLGRLTRMSKMTGCVPFFGEMRCLNDGVAETPRHCCNGCLPHNRRVRHGNERVALGLGGGETCRAWSFCGAFWRRLLDVESPTWYVPRRYDES
jgi:hypothetical protein